MVRPKVTEGMALSHALAQACEEMAWILRSEQEDSKELYRDDTEISAGPQVAERQTPLAQKHQKAKQTNGQWQGLHLEQKTKKRSPQKRLTKPGSKRQKS